MVRMQIQLSERQRRRLEAWARERGISLSEAVRRCVDGRLSREAATPPREERVRAALAVCGKYRDSDGDTHVASRHDRYLADAFAD